VQKIFWIIVYNLNYQLIDLVKYEPIKGGRNALLPDNVFFINFFKLFTYFPLNEDKL